MTSHRRQSLGFSLIELMLVVLTMAIAAAMVLPRYNNALDRYHADAAARRIAADLAMTRTLACSTSATQSLVLDPSSSSYQIPGATDPTRVAATYTVKLAAEPYVARLVQTNTYSVSFDGYGNPSAAASVMIQAGSSTRIVSVDATGVIAVQ